MLLNSHLDLRQNCVSLGLQNLQYKSFASSPCASPRPKKNKTKMSHVDPQIYIDLYCPPQDYTEDYVQTGPGQLYAYSTRLFTVDGIGVPYTWNHTVFYDQARGRMPFLVETLHASSVESDYNQLEETLGFKIHASISKGNLLEGESRYSQKSQ